MNILRDLWIDLVDKRLWPVAAVLLVALVAIPVALSKPADKPAAPPPGATAAQDDMLPEPVVSVAGEGVPGVRSGAARDPFKQQHVSGPVSDRATDSLSQTSAVAASGGLAPTTEPSSGGGSSAGGGGGGGGSTGSGSGGATTGSPGGGSGTADDVEPATLRVRFGPVGDMTTRTLPPLTALPGLGNAFVIYLGLRKDGETAAFMVSSDASVSGGKCEPSRANCVTLNLGKDQSALFNVGGKLYRLEYVEVVKD